MSGPIPKPTALRQRRNRVSTGATLVAEGSERQRAPSRPTHRDWQPMTRAWWKDTWRSPMAAEFLRADVHGLYILAELVDAFWTDPEDLKLAAEIRQHRMAFGLTPIDRRRLQWEVERVEERRRLRPQALEKRGGRKAADPRAMLGMVKGRSPASRPWE